MDEGKGMKLPCDQNVSSTGSVTARRRVPTPRPHVSVQTSMYAGGQVGRRGVDQGVLRRIGMRLDSYGSFRHSDGATRTASVRLLQEHARPPPTRCGSWATASSASRTYIGDCCGDACARSSAPGKVNIYNIGTEKDCQVADSMAGYRGARNRARASYKGGERGGIGDHPVIPARLPADARARGGAEHDDPARTS